MRYNGGVMDYMQEVATGYLRACRDREDQCDDQLDSIIDYGIVKWFTAERGVGRPKMSVGSSCWLRFSTEILALQRRSSRNFLSFTQSF
jgi:hypothetical protein